MVDIVTPVQWNGQEVYPSQSILLCAWRGVTNGTFDILTQMCRQGLNKPYNPDEPAWGLLQQAGDAAIYRSRGRIVTAWYENTPDDVFLMVDDDVIFHPDAATRIITAAREKRSIVCGAYATKGGTHFAFQAYAGQNLRFAADAPLTAVKYPATGFMAVHRDVITAMIAGEKRVNTDMPGGGYFPIFCPMVSEFAPGEYEELSEDYAFGERARRLGFTVWLDPAIYLEHEGVYRWTIDDVMRRAREGTGLYHVIPPVDDLAADPRLAEVGA